MPEEEYTKEIEYEEELPEETLPEAYEEAPAPAKKSSGKKKRRKKNYLLRFLIFCALVAGSYFFLSSDLFIVTNIQVEGNRYYTQAQVIELSGLSTGYNMFFEVETKPARNKLLERPYIKYAKIRRLPMGTLVIDVTERTEYAAVPYGEQFILIDEEGMVLRISDTEVTLPLLEGMSVAEMEPGKPLSVEQSYLLTGTLGLLTAMEENDIYFKRVYFSTVVVKAYIYDNYYCEGTPENITANLSGISRLLQEHYQQNITRGVVKVGKSGYLSFSPNIE